MAPGVVPSSLHGGLHHFLTSQHPPLIHSHGWPSCKLQWTLTNIKIWLLIWAEGTSHGKQSWQIKRTQEMHWQEHPHIREETFQPQPGIYCLGSKRRGHATGTGSSSRQILGWVVSFTTSKHFSHSPPFFVSADPFVVSCPAGKTSVFLLEVLLKLLHFKQPKCQYFTRSTQMLRNPNPPHPDFMSTLQNLMWKEVNLSYAVSSFLLLTYDSTGCCCFFSTHTAHELL